jgi:hypothetical protein
LFDSFSVITGKTPASTLSTAAANVRPLHLAQHEGLYIQVVGSVEESMPWVREDPFLLLLLRQVIKHPSCCSLLNLFFFHQLIQIRASAQVGSWLDFTFESYPGNSRVQDFWTYMYIFKSNFGSEIAHFKEEMCMFKIFEVASLRSAALFKMYLT